MVLWVPMQSRIWPPKPLPVGWTNTPVAEASGPLAKPAPSFTNAPDPASIPSLVPSNREPERLVTLTNGVARYTFTSHGGGLKSIDLLDYPETTASHRGGKAPSGTKRVATLNRHAPFPAMSLAPGGPWGDGVYRLSSTPTSLKAECALTNGLVITKEFQLLSNYLVGVTTRLENRSDRPIEAAKQEWITGTATPMTATDQAMSWGVLWYNGASVSDDVGASFFSSRGFACVPRVPPTEYRGGASNVVWVAAHNQFFVLAAMMKQPALATVTRQVELPRPSGDDALMMATNAATPQGYQASIEYPSTVLAPKQSQEHQLFLYAGPKEYQALARIGDQFGNNLDLVMNFGWYGPVSKTLLLGMNLLHHLFKLPYGWAVVMITVIIKLVFWPLTQASTRSMKRMQALQPQVKAIQDKYKDDPVKVQRKMMELWKEHKVSPMSGCLPMLIQIPVFFGFYKMITSAIELRGASFLWAADLSKPDTLFVIPGLSGIPFFGVPGVGLPFNLLPLIMGGSMLWQSHLTPPSPGMDPAQAKLMRYLPLLFLAGFYNLSAGLTLYWTVNNLLSVAQTKLIRATDATATPGSGLTTAGKKGK